MKQTCLLRRIYAWAVVGPLTVSACNPAAQTAAPVPNDTAATHRLTLNMRSGNATARGMNVRILVGEVAYTRADAPYNDGTIQLADFTNNADPDAFALDIPAGKTATLIAIESPGSFGSAFGQSDPENFVDPFDVEFVTWEGDHDATPESGVATILMDGDKEVTAVYAQMPRVLIRKFDGSNDQLSGGCLDITIVPALHLGLPGADDLTTPPVHEGESPELFCCCNAEQGDLFLFGQVKTGTQITLNASDSNGCDAVSGICSETFLEWRGSAALCGSSRECMMTVGVDVDASAVWEDNGS